MEDASIKKYLSDKAGLLSEYKKQFGSVVNTDLARRLFRDVGYNGGNSAAVQEAASALAKDAWRDALKTNTSEKAYIFAGGSGTGKSSAVKSIFPDMGNSAILDGNLSNIGSAVNRILEAVKSGKEVVVPYVYRDPVESWVEGVVKRMNHNPEEGGRIVPMSVFLQNHPGSLEVVKDIMKIDGVHVVPIDNSLGFGKQQLMSLDKFNKIGYDVEKLKTRLVAETKRLLQEKIITKDQYDQLIK